MQSILFAPRSRRLGHESLESRRMLSLSPQLVTDLGIHVSRGELATAVVGEELFFFNLSESMEGSEGQGLWRTDGSPEGTVQLANLFGGIGCGAIRHIEVIDNTLYFRAHSDEFEGEWWMSDGTVEGTRPAPDGVPERTEKEDSEGRIAVRDYSLFVADDPRYGRELWSSEGTADVAEMLVDARPGRAGSDPQQLTLVGDKLFFVTLTSDDRRELWTTDGTAEGTTVLTDFVPDDVDPSPGGLTALGNELVFTMNDGESGTELWKSDGTLEGTMRVRDVIQGEEGSTPKYLTNIQGTLFFNAKDDQGGNQLWKSDGTTEGTSKITDFDFEQSNGWRMGPNNFEVVGGTLIFTSRDGDSLKLWKLTPPPGDTNFDGLVDLVDFSRLKANFGKEESNLAGDLNYDNKVDLVDFEILKGSFGNDTEGATFDSDGTSLAAAAVIDAAMGEVDQE